MTRPEVKRPVTVHEHRLIAALDDLQVSRYADRWFVNSLVGLDMIVERQASRLRRLGETYASVLPAFPAETR